MENNKYNYSLHLVHKTDREELLILIKGLEEKTNKKGLADSLIIILGELINNAVKLNIRRLYFASKGYNFDNEESYKMGIENFKLNFGHLNFTHYEKALKMLNLKVDINVDLGESSLVIIVQNNNNMPEEEEKMMRRRLNEIMEKSETFKELKDLYIHYGDHLEEGTLGLAISIGLLSSLGYDPSLLRIYNEGEFTKARIEIPLNNNFVSVRKKEL